MQFVSAWQKTGVLESLLGFPALPVSLVKDNIMSVYKISRLYLYPITATMIPASGCDFHLFTMYLVTEELPKGLNHTEVILQSVKEEMPV